MSSKIPTSSPKSTATNSADRPSSVIKPSSPKPTVNINHHLRTSPQVLFYFLLIETHHLSDEIQLRAYRSRLIYNPPKSYNEITTKQNKFMEGLFKIEIFHSLLIKSIRYGGKQVIFVF